jgi:thiol:disulfide interchange protein DsbA
MQTFRRFGALAALLCVFSAVAQADLVRDRDYRLIDPPQPVESGGEVEVLEFFWYGCPHCYHLEPSLTAWLKHKPDGVVFKRVPAVFSESWVPLTKAYFTMEALGLVDKLNDAVYKAIHEEHMRLQDPRVLFDWVAKRGVDRQKFADTYNSFAVKSRAQHAIDMTKRYDIPGTPSLVVDGKYLTAPSMTLNANNTIDYDRYFRVLDEVITLARKNRPRK